MYSCDDMMMILRVLQQYFLQCFAHVRCLSLIFLTSQPSLASFPNAPIGQALVSNWFPDVVMGWGLSGHHDVARESLGFVVLGSPRAFGK